jgi:hypothetical protein
MVVRAGAPQRAGSSILRSVHFVDDQNGWAVGANGTAGGNERWGCQLDPVAPGDGVPQRSFYPQRSRAGDCQCLDQSIGTHVQRGRCRLQQARRIFRWDPSSTHTLATISPQAAGAGTRYVWTGWTNGGAISQDIAPATSASYVANFTKQYQLTMQSAPNGTTSPASGWLDAGTSLQISATPDGGFGFNGWTGTGAGSYSGWSNPASVKMSGPVTETPAFSGNVTVVVKTSPAGRSFVVDGTPYSAQQSFSWAAGSSHTVDAPSPQGASNEYTFSHWSDSGASTHTIAPVSNTTCTAYFTGGSNTPEFPSELTLLQNVPNPASSQTDIRYGLPTSSNVTIELFDVSGRRVFRRSRE